MVWDLEVPSTGNMHGEGVRVQETCMVAMYHQGDLSHLSPQSGHLDHFEVQSGLLDHPGQFGPD